jgi:branched-chain amino acid transport system ATP-binding protein
MGLAPLVVQSIFNTLKRLNREEGVSILLAEQNTAVALQYADRATVLENGLSVLEGNAAELRHREDVRAFYLGAGEPAAKAPDVRATVAA